MSRKNWIILGISISVLGVVTYLVFKQKKDKKRVQGDDKKIDENNSILETNVIKTNSTIISEIDRNSRAVKITEKKLNQLKDLLSNYEFRNGAVYDSKTKGKISEVASWTVWGSLNRTYLSLVSGIQNDLNINSRTKQYALNVANQYKELLSNVFPAPIFTANSKLYSQYKLDTIKPVDVYNEKLTS